MSELDELLDPGVRNQSPISGGDGRLPHATAVLALGIISIVTCFFYGIPGLVCGIIALSLHKKDKAIYATDPARYEMAFKNSKAGFVCAVIGTSLSALYMLILIFVLVFATSMALRF